MKIYNKYKFRHLKRAFYLKKGCDVVDLSKHIPVKIVEDEESDMIVLRGGIGGKILTINSSTIKERITQEINELENQLKYAGEFLQYDKLYEINCKLEVLKKVLGV